MEMVSLYKCNPLKLPNIYYNLKYNNDVSLNKYSITLAESIVICYYHLRLLIVRLGLVILVAVILLLVISDRYRSLELSKKHPLFPSLNVRF